MNISNIRIERKGEMSYLMVDVSARFTSSNRLWFSVPSDFENWLSDDVYDAFLVAAIYPSMFYGEDIEIEGAVSHKLYYNCSRYIQHIVKAYRDEMSLVNIHAKGFSNARKDQKLTGTGFSAGIDSFSTFYDHFVCEEDDEYRISALFFFNVGSHGGGGEKARRVFENRYHYLKPFADENGLPYVPVDSNLFDFYKDHWEFDAGQFCRSCAILVFQRVLSKYFVSSNYSYKESMFYSFDPKRASLSAIVENYANPMLSTEELEVITDGGQYTRTEKTKIIAQYEPSWRYLNVCINHWENREEIENCGKCTKCLRTLVALDTLGELDKFSKVFDTQHYYKNRTEYKCRLRLEYNKSAYIKDNVDFAKKSGRPFPPYFIALVYMFFVRVGWQFEKIKKLVKK